MNARVLEENRMYSKAVFLAISILMLLISSSSRADSCSSTEHRQLDYWIGNWKIGAEGSSANARSTVTVSLDKCLLVENWDGGRGHRGQNVFGYSADDKTWYGLFADNEGRVHVFTSGRVADGKAEFEGTSLGPNRENILNRVRVVRVNLNQIEQTWEKSTDKGATWNVVFRGEYSRANP